MPKTKAKTTAERSKNYRAKMQASGMRLIQIWVPDTQSPKFLQEAERQSLAVANDPQEKEIMDFLEQTADYDGWVG